MPSRCNGDRDDDLRVTLCQNVGRVCTIYTTAGGRGGEGFTGVLSEVDCETCHLISGSYRHMNGGYNGNGRRNYNDRYDRDRCARCDRRNHGEYCENDDHDYHDCQGSTLTIPIDRITCISTPPY